MSIPKDFDARNPNPLPEIRSDHRKWVKSRHFGKMADARKTTVLTLTWPFEGSPPMFSRSADPFMKPEVVSGDRISGLCLPEVAATFAFNALRNGLSVHVHVFKLAGRTSATGSGHWARGK